MTDERDNSPPSDDLTERIRAARERERVERRGTERSGRARVSGLGLGFRIAIEMVAGVLVGAGLGYGLDVWLGSRPWLMVVFLFLGAISGVLNAYRVARGMDESVGLGRAQDRARDRSNDS